ncbi:myosin-2 essential light chain-like [Varroa jacobsoni]|uniref:EF-hand domain-containing protein n=1 Tax=Varroa destructor TaxID=109461 RepID=A0A7M7JKV3_VARDE|nr:myosin-2 essential light chain-like [Varroa destructor]XP_022687460.1 myosin-2 essential light chain-like [Varroa jacobsoni]
MAAYSDELIPDYQEAFNLFDSRGDGKINVSQLGDVLRALGQNPTEADVAKFSSQAGGNKDANKDKEAARISFDEFLPVLAAISKNRSSDTPEDFIEGLRHFDKEANGYISSAELRHLLTTLGEKLSDDEVEQLLAGQEDSHGNVHYEDFVRMLMSG